MLILKKGGDVATLGLFSKEGKQCCPRQKVLQVQLAPVPTWPLQQASESMTLVYANRLSPPMPPRFWGMVRFLS